MVEKTSKLNKKPGIEEQLRQNLKLGEEVFRRINWCFKERGWRSDQAINSQDILFPTISIQSQNFDQTKEVLREVGLPNGLSVAYIKREGQEIKENPIIKVSGQQLKPENFKGYSYSLDLFLGDLFSKSGYTYIVFNTSKQVTTADVRGLDADGGIKVSLGRIYLGEDPVTRMLKPAGEGVLLIDGGSPQNISSVFLPRNWRRAVGKDGRLLRKSK